jgi:hypothetical protein
MQRFHCLGCGQAAYLRNDWCTRCQAPLGFSTEQWAFVPLEAASAEGARPCAHRSTGLCNWLVAADDPHEHCISCRLTTCLPRLGQSEVDGPVYQLELAKRRLLLSLRELGLPALPGETRLPLRFAFLTDLPDQPPVMTGHAEGLITINIKEADPRQRLDEQLAMGETQRTVLGHLRHESGHFYWDEWFGADPTRQARFRELFGDERCDYAQALAEHHAHPRPWDPLQPNGTISRYALAHPWEDWAETWAHYLLMLDALSETTPPLLAGELVREQDLPALLDLWLQRAHHGNALNRALGLPDAYPFVIDEGVRAKLGFIHGLVREQAQSR